MKIAHISDIHLNTFYKESNLKRLKHLIKYALSAGFDHMAITGDLTDNADQEDFEILRSLFRKYELLHTDRLSIVIGNHDIFGGVRTAEDILTFPERCRKVNYYEKVNEFVSYFSEAFDKCLLKAEEVHFPFAKAVDNVLITGLNSISQYSPIKNPFGSNGIIDLDQLTNLIDIFSNFGQHFDKRIVLIHHHLNKIKMNGRIGLSDIWKSIEKQTMKMRKKKRLFTLFKEYNVDMVLHGHLHETKEYDRKGIRFLNAGASIKGSSRDEMQINFITLNPEKMITEIHRLSSNISEVIHKGVKIPGVVLNESGLLIESAA